MSASGSFQLKKSIIVAWNVVEGDSGEAARKRYVRMNKAIGENRLLILVAALLLAVALYITLVPEMQAQGRCRKVRIQYWSQEHQAYITTYVWRCTGYQQPRPYYGPTYNYYRYRRH